MNKWINRSNADVKMAERRRRWSCWDWTQQDITLSEKVGLSRERIRQIRKLLGQPLPLNYKQLRRPSVMKALLQLIKDGVTLDLTYSQIAEKIGSTYSTVCTYASHLEGIPHKDAVLKRGPLIELVDWTLPNSVLAKIYNKPTYFFAGKRYKYQKGNTHWAKSKRSHVI